MAGEQTAGNGEEAPFPGSGCGLAGKGAAGSGSDWDLGWQGWGFGLPPG